MCCNNSQELPEDGVDKRRNASELKSDQHTKKCVWMLVNKKCHALICSPLTESLSSAGPARDMSARQACWLFGPSNRYSLNVFGWGQDWQILFRSRAQIADRRFFFIPAYLSVLAPYTYVILFQRRLRNLSARRAHRLVRPWSSDEES